MSAKHASVGLRLITWLGAVCVLIFCLTSAALMVAFDMGFYRAEFEKHRIYGAFEGQYGPAELDEAAVWLIAYMEGISPALDPSFFDDRERAHMADVRRLFTIDKALAAFSLILTCVLFFTRPRVGAAALLRGGALALGLVVAAGIWAALDFDSFFPAFHMVAFNNDLWQLDPSTSNLLKLVPEPFFFDAGMRVGLLAAAHAALLGFAGFFARKIVKVP